MSDSPEQAVRPTAAQPTGKYGAGILSILLLAGGFLLLFIPAMWMLAALKWADKPLLVAVALLTLAGWWLARQRGYARQEEQARFHQLTLLCGLAIPLSQSFWPEIRLAGGGLGRVVDALLHLDMYALRLGIQALQLGIAVLVCVRLWRSIGDVLPRRPLSGCRDCGKVRLIAYLSFQLLVVGVLLGSIIYFFRFR